MVLAGGNNQDLGPPETLTPDGHDVRGLPENQEMVEATPVALQASGQLEFAGFVWYWWLALLLLVVGLGYAVWFQVKKNTPKRGRPKLP